METRRRAIAVGLSILGMLAGAPSAPGAAVSAQDQTPAKPRLSPYRFRILGVYDEQSGEPLERVEVADVLNHNSALTTKTGTVSLYFLPDGGALVSIRKLGYEVQTLAVAISPADTTPITVLLKRAVTLPTVSVRDSAPGAVPAKLVGYMERKKLGFGHFIDDSVFRKNESHLLADILPARMPGLQLSMGPYGQRFLASSRKQCSGPAILAKCSPTKQPSCFVAVYLDGVRIFDPALSDKATPPDFSRMGAQDYTAAEFYQGAAIPAEFNSSANSDCGVLLLWTRVK